MPATVSYAAQRALTSPITQKRCELLQISIKDVIFFKMSFNKNVLKLKVVANNAELPQVGAQT